MADKLTKTVLIEGTEYDINAVYSDEAGKTTNQLTLTPSLAPNSNIADKYKGDFDGSTDKEVFYVPAEGGLFKGPVYTSYEGSDSVANINKSTLLNNGQVESKLMGLKGEPLYSWDGTQLTLITNSNGTVHKLNTVVGPAEKVDTFIKLLGRGSDGLKFDPYYFDNTVLTVSKGDFNDTTLVVPYKANGQAVKYIQAESFWGTTGLFSIVLSSNIVQILRGAFNSCTDLKSITLPASVTQIDAYAFYNCPNLTDIFYDGTPEQWEQLLSKTATGNDTLISMTPTYTTGINLSDHVDEPFLVICNDTLAANYPDSEASNAMYLKLPPDPAHPASNAHFIEISKGATRLNSLNKDSAGLDHNKHYTYESLAEIIARINTRLDGLGVGVTNTALAPLHSVDEVNALVPDVEVTETFDPEAIPTIEELAKAIVKSYGTFWDSDKVMDSLNNVLNDSTPDSIAELRLDLNDLAREVDIELNREDNSINLFPRVVALEEGNTPAGVAQKLGTKADNKVTLTSVGTINKPVYFENGIPKECSDVVMKDDNYASLTKTVTDTAASVESITKWQPGINESLASINQKADSNSASITQLVQKDAELSSTIAEVKSVADTNKASIDSITTWKSQVDPTMSSVASISQKADSNEAKIESLTAWKGTASEAITNITQKASANESSISSLTTWKSTVDPTISSITSIKQVADANTASITQLAQKDTELTTAIAGVETITTNTAAAINSIAEWKNATATTIANIQQTASADGAKVAMMAEHYDTDGNLKAASVVAAVNALGESEVKIAADNIDFTAGTYTISADHLGIDAGDLNINLDGYVTISDLEGGKTTIDGSCIKTNTLKASELNLTGFSLSASDYVTGLSGVATSGSYNDLSGKPDLTNYTTNQKLAQELASYATSGELAGYLKTNDLSTKLGNLNVAYRGDVQTTQTTDSATGITTTTSTYVGSDGETYTTTTYTTEGGNYVLLNRDNQWGSGDSLVKVSKDGLLQANNAIITGTVYSAEGDIAGWKINEGSISSKGTLISSSDTELYASIADPNIKVPVRFAAGGGYSYTRYAEATKDINAGTATYKQGLRDGEELISIELTRAYAVAVWSTSVTIEAKECQISNVNADGTFTVYWEAPDHYKTNVEKGEYVPKIAYTRTVRKLDTTAETSFRVLDDGSLYARNADISGNIQATGGDIGGWSIGNNKLYVDQRLACFTPEELSFGDGDADELYGTWASFTKSGLAFFDDSTDQMYYARFTADGVNAVSTATSSIYTFATWRQIIDTVRTDAGSDLRIKNSIEELNDKYDYFFDLLAPKRYKYNQGTSNRYHTGFIAQEVVASLEAAQLNTKDFAAVMLDNPGAEDECWYLRRDEFVALNTWQIQKLKARTSELEIKVIELEAKLKELIK